MEEFKKKPHPSFLDQEVQVTIKPRHMIKWALFVFLLVLVFFLGRCSAEGSGTVSTVKVEEASSSPGLLASLKDLIVGLTEIVKSSPNETTSSAPATLGNNSQGNTSSGSPTGSTVNNTTIQNTSTSSDQAAESADDGETVIAKYTGKVALAVSSVSKKWMETWGKITSIQYTIKNNEAGTVKPSYFIMNVKGYPDFNKNIPLPLSQQSVKAGATITANVNVPSGFAYNKVTVGDLTSVEITLQLYDADGKVIASTIKSVNLES